MKRTLFVMLLPRTCNARRKRGKDDQTLVSVKSLLFRMVEFSSPVFLLRHSCAWAPSLGGNVGEMFVFA